MKRNLPRWQIGLRTRLPCPAICDEMSFFSCPRLLLIREFVQSANHPVEGVPPNRAEIAG